MTFCHLPLYIFCGEHLLCARLRTADQDAAAGSREQVERIVQQIRQAWPEVKIIVRTDSGFCRKELMRWCEDHQVYYTPGFARNERIRKLIDPQLREAAGQYEQTKKPARVFTELAYHTTTGSWSRARRVIAKAEQLEGKENPRYVVTNLAAEQRPAQELYELCSASTAKWRTGLRSSCRCSPAGCEARRCGRQPAPDLLRGHGIRAGSGFRRLALSAPELAHAQATPIRLRLLKIGAQIRITTRNIWVSIAPSSSVASGVRTSLAGTAPLRPAATPSGADRERQICPSISAAHFGAPDPAWRRLRHLKRWSPALSRTSHRSSSRKFGLLRLLPEPFCTARLAG